MNCRCPSPSHGFPRAAAVEGSSVNSELPNVSFAVNRTVPCRLAIDRLSEESAISKFGALLIRIKVAIEARR